MKILKPNTHCQIPADQGVSAMLQKLNLKICNVTDVDSNNKQRNPTSQETRCGLGCVLLVGLTLALNRSYVIPLPQPGLNNTPNNTSTTCITSLLSRSYYYRI